MKEFKVYDKVWLMENNKPQEKFIYSREERMGATVNDSRNVETIYNITDEILGAGIHTSRVSYVSVDNLFSTCDELLDSLRPKQ